jgi:type IV secretion system protein VirB3
MRWGVTYSAILANMIITMEAFLLSRNLLMLLWCLPIHGICALMCARDPRYFDLALLWGKMRIPALLANLAYWRASSYSPLAGSHADARGRRGRCGSDPGIWAES